MAEDFRLPALNRVFDRYPQLTRDQMAEICRRRIKDALYEAPYAIGDKYDIYFAEGFIREQLRWRDVDTRVFVKKD